MGFDPNGGCSNQAPTQTDLFALVVYIPDPLRRFLDDLRRSLSPGCNPHAHVSLLPPRTLKVPWQLACEEARRLTGDFAPFHIQAGDVQVFRQTDVVYLEVGAGGDDLRRMHARLSQGPLAFPEPFEYHPHITLAQDIPPASLNEIYDSACRAWETFRGDRGFEAEKAVFVHSQDRCCWRDLAEFSLGAALVSSV